MSFPQPFVSSTSHWQATNRGPTSLYNHNKDAIPPSEADILIIGGGMMGAALSYFLTRNGAEGHGKKIVLVEAKDIASGASGRNGGHIGPATFNAYHNLLKPLPSGAGLSSREAVHVIQAERDNLELITDIIRKEGLVDKVDFWKVPESPESTIPQKSMYLSWLAARQSFGLTGNGDTSFVEDVSEAKRISRFKHASSVHLRPAGSVHSSVDISRECQVDANIATSHKLCTELVRLSLQSSASDFDFYTWNPVSSLKPTADGARWLAKTARGDIKAKRVVLCVNAYTKNFFSTNDPLHSHIKPHFSQVALITPPATYSGEKALQYTYNMADDAYLIQTPTGGLVLGGGAAPLIRAGKLSPTVSDATDDSSTIKVWDDWLAKYCPEHFEGWGPEGKGEGLTRVWSGILSQVKDKLPVVGPVPGKEGLFLAAGFHGHGMSRIFSTGRALASTMKTGVFDEKLLPRSFELTTERLNRVRDMAVVKDEACLGEKKEEMEASPPQPKPGRWGCTIA
ncbi:hypothetical protein P7C73_g3382, partial [Tremellales sp. Uapishka_1]